MLCLEDISADSRRLAYTLNNQIYVVAADDAGIQTVAPTSADYADYNAAPGCIALLQPPCDGPAEIFHQADNLTVVNAIVGDYLYFWQNHDAARNGLERPHEIIHYRRAALRRWLP